MPKEDFFPGQTKELDPNAADTEALITFYQSLYKQRPDSEMAQKWLLQFGQFPDGEEESKKWFKIHGKGGATKSSSTASKPAAKKSKATADDDDFTSKPKSKAPTKKAPAKKPAAEPDSSDEEFESKKKPPAKKPAAAKPPAKRPGACVRACESVPASAATLS